MQLKARNIKASQKFKGISLRLILVLPFILQIVGAVGLVGYLSFKNGEEAVKDLANQLMVEEGRRQRAEGRRFCLDGDSDPS